MDARGMSEGVNASIIAIASSGAAGLLVSGLNLFARASATSMLPLLIVVRRLMALFSLYQRFQTRC